MRNEDNIKVSILVPFYNDEKYIKRCAISIFEQSYKNIEYIFVNDKSEDNSLVELNNTILSYPNRKNSCKIINHFTNRGVSAARNTAIDNAKGDFILWVDADDYIDKNTVSCLICKQQENDYDIVLYDHVNEFNSYSVNYSVGNFSSSKEYTIRQLSGTARATVWGQLIRTQLYSIYNIRCLAGYNMGEDFQMSVFLSYYARRLTILHMDLYHYNRTNINASTSQLINEKLCRQADYVHDYISSFFEDKESSYSEAFQIGLLKRLSHQIIDLNKDGRHDIYYKEQVERIKKIDRSYIKYMPFANKLAIKLIEHKKAQKFIFKNAANLKHSLQRIKNLK